MPYDQIMNTLGFGNVNPPKPPGSTMISTRDQDTLNPYGGKQSYTAAINKRKFENGMMMTFEEFLEANGVDPYTIMYGSEQYKSWQDKYNQYVATVLGPTAQATQNIRSGGGGR